MCGPREGHMQSGDWDISLVKLDRDEEIEIYARSSLSKSTDNKEGRYDGEQGIVSGREMYNERVGVRGRHWHSNEVGWIEAIANVSPNWNSSLGESLSYCSRLLQEKPYNTLLFFILPGLPFCNLILATRWTSGLSCPSSADIHTLPYNHLSVFVLLVFVLLSLFCSLLLHLFQSGVFPYLV